MGWHHPMDFIASLPARFRRPASTVAAGSAASSVALTEVGGASPEEALQRLGSAATGLTTQEAGTRLHSVGPNEVAHEAHQTILLEIATRSLNPLNMLLLALAVASYSLGDKRAALVIAIMVLLSISLGFYQEHRSTNAAAALR